MEPLFLVNRLFPAYWVGQPGFALERIPSNFAYVLDGQGWKLFKRNGVSTALISVESVTGLATLEQNFLFTAQKLPLDLVRKVAAWFKAVYQKYRSEAAGYLLYQPATGEWDYVPPTQTAGPASVKYEMAPKKEGWIVAGTIHSHADMSAFHSGTDDHDEQFFDGVHITIGKVASVPEYSCSIVVQGKREVVDPSMLVDGMAPANMVPASWLAAVKEPAPRGLDPLFLQVRAEKLYEAYYAGKISEEAYKRDLGKLKAEERAHRQAEMERQRELTARIPASHDGYSGYSGLGRTHSFGPEDYDGLESERPRGPVGHQSKTRTPKGGTHGKKK